MSDESRQPPSCDSKPAARPAAAPRRRDLSLDEYVAGVQAGDVAILARALTLVESSHARHARMAEELLTRLLPSTGQAIRVGITGAPGSGKSTFIESLGLMLARLGRKIAVLAVDPSSGISGGSILGDKTRMAGLAAHPSAYIRPSPSAGTLGGVARKTREGMLVCEAAGFDVVLIETVGVGQSETMVADLTDCFLALLLPGAGDELQGIKRGLLEFVDVVAVNKADGATRAAAELAARQYSAALSTLAPRAMPALAPQPEDDHRYDGPSGPSTSDGMRSVPATVPAVLTCSALRHEGVDRVWEALERTYRVRRETGELAARRRQQNLRWLWNIIDDRLRQAIRSHPAVDAVRASLEQDVAAGVVSPEAAARRILDEFGIG
jgi:LAO/AO transport system kinase